MSTISSVSSKDEGLSVQHLSIHQLSMRKVCRFFSIQDEFPKLLDLIVKIVTLFNVKKKHQSYELLVKDSKISSFHMTVYAQITETNSRLAKWVANYQIDKDLTTRKIDYLFFFYRQFELNNKTKKVSEIFALSSGQAYRVIQRYADFRFPIQILKRLFSPEIMSSKNRPLVGRVLIYSEILKQGSTVSDTDALDKLFTRMKFKLRKNASIFQFGCFKSKEGKPLHRGIASEFGLGLIRFTKQIPPEDYVEILEHLSKIASGEKTFCFSQKKEKEEEKDSDDFDFLEYVHPVDFSLVPGLNQVLENYIYKTVVQGEEFPPFDFCHKNSSDYFMGIEHKLHYKKNMWDCLNPFSATYMVDKLKEIPTFKSNIDEKNFFEELNRVSITFQFQGRRETGAFFDFLEGELRVGNGECYWRIRKMWYEVQADYLSLVHQEFGEMLKKDLIESKDPPALTLKWPSPKDKENQKKKLEEEHKKTCSDKKKCKHKPKYDTEAEYNQTYLSKKNYLLGDKICPQGIELFDILHWTTNNVYLYHVKEGFGQKTRDACSQIYQSARQIHTLRQKGSSNILHQFYVEATSPTAKGAYRQKVKEKLETLTENEFFKLFEKKIVFVYAFADDSQRCRFLSSDKGLKTSITPTGLAEAEPKFKEQGQELFNALVKEKYVTPKGYLTSKFFSTSQTEFTLAELKVKDQQKKLHKYLSKFKTKFDSTIAKLELHRVKQEVEKLGFKFLICQIPRTDYPDSKPPKTSSKAGRGDSEVSQAESEEKMSQISGSPKGYAEISALPDIKDTSLQEGHTFSDTEGNFTICETEGDGACALHAILGEKKDGKYIYPGSSPNQAAREKFTTTLKEKFKQMQEHYVKCLVSLLKGYLSISQSTYEKQIFQGLTETLDKQLKEDKDNKKEEILKDFVLTDRVFNKYIEVCQDANYYFSDEEIGLAAYLFDKNIKIFAHLHANDVYNLKNYNEKSKEEVIIFHKGIHYSRCERVVNSILSLKRKRASTKEWTSRKSDTACSQSSKSN